MILDGAGERAFPVAEQFGFDEALRKLREIDGNERLQEIRREAANFAIEGDEARTPDRSGGGSLSGSGFTQQHGGKIFHAIPQAPVVIAHVVSEYRVP